VIFKNRVGLTSLEFAQNTRFKTLAHWETTLSLSNVFISQY